MTIRTLQLREVTFLTQNSEELFNVPGRPVIPNCATLIEKASEFFDHHLKPIKKSSWSYIKDSGDFLRKIKQIGHFLKNS